MGKYQAIKCRIDFFIAFLALFLVSPLLLMTALAIKLESTGPVFFLQERLGKDGKIFIIYKFRTMVDGAIHLGNGLHTDADDSRITKIGKILRKTSIDELPQLFNILKGDMSIIGPRPPVPYYPRNYDDYLDYQQKRFSVKPGITGYAQVLLRNSAPWDQRIELDIKYINNMSFRFDLYIFMKTICVVLAQVNIYNQTKT